jgi:hypothetical protein
VMWGGEVLYVAGLDRWPDDLRGHTVHLEGTLRRSDELQAQVGPSGVVSAGLGGPIWRVEGATWSLVP